MLGDRLLVKSETVVDVPVKIPHKRSYSLKNHSELVNLAKTSPESEYTVTKDIVTCVTIQTDQKILKISVCTTLSPTMTATARIMTGLVASILW